MPFLEEGLNALRCRMEDAAHKSGREFEDITLVAATKTQPWETVWDAFDGGIRHFGENYIQEAMEKAQTFRDQKMDTAITWHFLGQLQSRKVKQAVGEFELIHSMDRMKLAVAMDQEAGKREIVQRILLQVNVGGEESKGGVSIESAPEAVESMNGLANLKLEGLMSLPPYELDPDATRPYHAALRILMEKLNDRKIYKDRLTLLSMGMTHDFEQAILEGATHIRVGTLLFGPRPLKKD